MRALAIWVLFVFWCAPAVSGPTDAASDIATLYKGFTEGQRQAEDRKYELRRRENELQLQELAIQRLRGGSNALGRSEIVTDLDTNFPAWRSVITSAGFREWLQQQPNKDDLFTQIRYPSNAGDVAGVLYQYTDESASTQRANEALGKPRTAP